ncbi:MAG: HupE/UreJ family protein [Phycisphaerales bacterium]
MNRLLASVVLVAALAPCAFAHDVRPAYLEIRQRGPEIYDVLWKVPGRGGDPGLGLDVRFPADCTNVTEPRAATTDSALTERWTIRRPAGLDGSTIHVSWLDASVTDVLVRLERLDGTAQVARLAPSAPDFVVEAARSSVDVVRTYGVLGVEHILSGVDHLLFVLALLILTRGGWKLVKTVTAFTVAHSITLSAAVLGLVHVPQPPVEAVIALSIVFVAAEIVHGRQGRAGLAARAPWIVAFAFGLLHGLGFAGALSEIGLPRESIPLALLFFNVGVEVGQLLFIAAMLSLIGAFRLATRHLSLATPHPWAPLVPPYAIGGVAMFWVIERIASF